MIEAIVGGVVVIVLALLTLAVAWGTVLTRQKDMKEDIDELKTTRESLKVEYLTEKDHRLLCKNSTLRFEKHVTTVVNNMGKELVEKIEAIVNGDT